LFKKATRKGVHYRFWSKVQKTDGCWLWLGRPDKDGYGKLRVGGVATRAHRYSYALHVGPIPSGLMVCHHCDNPGCVRPDHLFLGTALDNASDAASKGRTALGDRNASRKHPERRPRGERHHWQTRPETRLRGERNGRAKLTPDDVHTIRALWSAGKANRAELARRYGVTHTLISNIVAGRLWKHLEEEPADGVQEGGQA
jgi:hypothetical protein